MLAITTQVLARADELMVDAPGQVSVRRIIEISDVRALRAARDVLSEDERLALQQLRLQTIERLDGSVAIASPKAKEKKPGPLGSVLLRLSGAASSFSGETRTPGGFQHLARQAGVVSRLPAPMDLIDAAEAWAISHLVADRVDTDLVVLRTPWLESTITTE